MYRLKIVIALAAAAACTAVPPASASSFAESGPPLATPISQLDAAVRCGPDAGSRKTVLLVHGTANSAEWSWPGGYQRALPRAGFAVCTVELPENALVSVYKSAEYVVHAIRVAKRASGRSVAVIGHSQGGSLSLWALAFWPDVRDAVDEFVGLAPIVSGAASANLGCALGSCPQLGWQLRVGSAFFGALHAKGIPRGRDYTVAYTQFDELVLPQPSASRIAGASNIAVQSICPLRPVEHVHMLGDIVPWTVALDALTHDGPANPARISRSVCGSLFLPAADVGRMFAGYVKTTARFLSFLLTAPHVAGEAPVPSYAQ